MGKIILNSDTTKQQEYKWILESFQNKEEPMLKAEDINKLDNSKITFFNSSILNDNSSNIYFLKVKDKPLKLIMGFVKVLTSLIDSCNISSQEIPNSECKNFKIGIVIDALPSSILAKVIAEICNQNKLLPI